jgi:K+-sensing histidine kinase KdpD
MHPTALTILIMLLAILICFTMSSWFMPIGGILLILQFGAASCAILYSRSNGLLAALIGAVSFNFLFTQPQFSIRMENIEDIINMATFVVVAFVTSEFTTFYQKQQKALRVAQMQADILRSVSHDLRTPLASIIGSMETLHEYSTNLEESEKTGLISGALLESKRLHAYIENILHATKIQNDLLIAARTPTDIERIFSDLESRFNTSRLEIFVLLSSPTIIASEPLLQQAIYNVVDNALKFSQDKVLIHVTDTEENLKITVKDNGCGLPNNDTEAPFQLFSSSRKGDIGKGGIGLGLNVARGIISAHKGTIQLRNTNPGCKVIIMLPTINEPAS